MSYAPSIDWALALKVSAAGSSDLPEIPAPELARLVADLRVTARRAGEIAAQALGIDSVGASSIKVVDWEGWGRAVRGMVDSVVAGLNLDRRPSGAITRLRGGLNALLLGAGIRVASRKLLGQYDAYGGSDTLYLVAPTILAHERKFGFVPGDFRLWVSLHEQTHALQFRAAPWLRDWVADRAQVVFEDDSSPIFGAAAWARTGDLSSLLAPGEAGESLSELIGTMTFLEGHADHLADTAGRGRIATVEELRRAFHRPAGKKGLGRLAPALDKNAQYRDGLEFCVQVTRRAGASALTAAFVAPENLPKLAEIGAPEQWLKRVHG